MCVMVTTIVFKCFNSVHCHDFIINVINPQRMCEGYSTHLFVCVCVIMTLEATLIYSSKNRN